MSRQFSIFTKVVAFFVVVAVCTAFVPSKVFAHPCDYEAMMVLAAVAVVYGSCGATGVTCVHAIKKKNVWSAAGCAFGLFTCAGSIWAAVAAIKSHENCLEREYGG